MEHLKQRNHLEDMGTIILKWILIKYRIYFGPELKQNIYIL
jgi:hypothetical protein